MLRRSSKTSLKRKFTWEENGDAEQFQYFEAPDALGGPPKSGPSTVTVKGEPDAANPVKDGENSGGGSTTYIVKKKTSQKKSWFKFLILDYPGSVTHCLHTTNYN